MEVLREGYRIPFLRPPPLSTEPIPLPSYAPTSIKGAAHEEVTLALIAKGAVELAPLPSPGFHSRLFVVWKTSGSWRPVIDLSLLNRFVDVSHFPMETIQSVLLSVRQGDWMASIDLREAYLQVPVHPESRRFLRFVAHGRSYQFRALCFGLSTAPQVFTRVMAPVSAILHSLGIRMRRYLDDWLVQFSSREELLRDLGVVLSLCRELGDRRQPGEVQLLPVSGGPVSRGGHRRADFCGFSNARSRPQAPVNSQRERSSSSQLMAVAVGDVVVSVPSGSRGPPADAVTPDLPPPLLGSVGSFDPGSVVSGLSSFGGGFTGIVSLLQVSPDLDFWSDASDVGWGAHLGDRVAPGLWAQSEALLPINARELLAVRHGLLHFQSFLSWATVAVFCDNVTAVAYLPKEGGTRSPALTPSLRRFCVGRNLFGFASLLSSFRDPQCSGGLSLPSPSAPRLRVVSQHGRVSVFVTSMAGDDRPLCHLSQSPLLHLFLAHPRSSFDGDGCTPPVLGRSPGVRFSSMVHSTSGVGEASGVPSDPPHPGRPLLASASVVRGPPSDVGGSSGDSSHPARPPLPATVSSALPGSPQAGPSCLETIQRFTMAAGFSSVVAAQASLALRPSSLSSYQLSSRSTGPGAGHRATPSCA